MINQLKDRIIYSYYVEKLSSNLYKRVNGVILLLIFLLGSSVVFESFNNIFAGLAIAFLSGIQPVYKLAAKSEKARIQANRYSKLITLAQHTNIKANKLLKEFLKIESEDIFRLSSLESSAMLLTRKHLSIENPAEYLEFSILSKLIISFAGGKYK